MMKVSIFKESRRTFVLKNAEEAAKFITEVERKGYTVLETKTVFSLTASQALFLLEDWL